MTVDIEVLNSHFTTHVSDIEFLSAVQEPLLKNREIPYLIWPDISKSNLAYVISAKKTKLLGVVGTGNYQGKMGKNWIGQFAIGFKSRDSVSGCCGGKSKYLPVLETEYSAGISRAMIHEVPGEGTLNVENLSELFKRNKFNYALLNNKKKRFYPTTVIYTPEIASNGCVLMLFEDKKGENWVWSTNSLYGLQKCLEHSKSISSEANELIDAFIYQERVSHFFDKVEPLLSKCLLSPSVLKF